MRESRKSGFCEGRTTARGASTRHLTNSVIHDANPVFDRKRLLFRYDNGMEEKIKVNRHLYEAGK